MQIRAAKFTSCTFADWIVGGYQVVVLFDWEVDVSSEYFDVFDFCVMDNAGLF
jgi:hypothetical protein